MKSTLEYCTTTPHTEEVGKVVVKVMMEQVLREEMVDRWVFLFYLCTDEGAGDLERSGDTNLSLKLVDS